MLVVALTAACSHKPRLRARPQCTWELWAVEGKLLRSDDGRSQPCQGPGAAECIGMTKKDFVNLLDCGAP